MSIAEKLQRIAENETAVYEAGGTAQCKAFWNQYLKPVRDGSDCQYMFSGHGWNDNTFRPAENITPTSAKQMFNASSIANLKGCLAACGVTLNFSKCSNLQEVFAYSSVTHIGNVSTVRAPNLTYAFYYATKLQSIDLIALKSDGTQTFSNAFTYCNALTDVTFSGVVGNTLDMRHSPLTKASITSVVNALSDTVTGKTLTLKATAKTAAFTDAEWAALIGTKPNWTISLV